jgi:peptidyl-prolyl cis-trans isomerase C
MKDEVLENLIAREVLYQKSKAEEIKVDEAMLDEHMATLKQQFPSEDEFKKTLGEMGLSEAGLRSDFERAKAIEQLLDEEVSKKIVISDEETKKYYAENPAMFKHPEQVRASHILITVDPKAEDSAKAASRAKLEAVQARLKQGEDFAALAKEVSQCPSASKGGDLGYFRQGQMVEPFEKAAFALKPGEVSDIVETQFGYHLIKVADHKPETVVGYDEIKERIAEHLKQDRLKDEIDRYVDTLKQEAKITKNLPE